MIEFRFPFIFYFYIPLILLWILWTVQSRKHTILPETDYHLRARLLHKFDANRFNWKKRLLFLSLIALVFAASGPQIGVRLAPVDRKGVDLVFAIDVSTSMNAEDVKPSRLEKSKLSERDTAGNLKGR